MGLSYSARVFYGVHLSQYSKAGKRLYKKIDENEGTPVLTKVDGVEIDICGALNGDPQFITIQIAGVDIEHRRDNAIGAPTSLPDSTGWEARIMAALNAEKIDLGETSAIGWHFASSVS